MTRGSLIVFEGLDGTGKSTQLPRLAQRIAAAGHEVVSTREPYDCAPGREIRALAQRAEPAAPAAELELFVAQRRIHVREVIEPALARGAVVLSDRYFLSTVAYQGARGHDPDRLLRESEAEFPLPDLALLLDLDPAAGLARVGRRGAVREPAFEEAAYLERVAAIFRRIDRHWLVRIDAGAAPEVVHERVLGAVERVLAR